MHGKGVTARVGPTGTIILHITVYSAAVAVHYEDLQDDLCSDNSKSFSCILVICYMYIGPHSQCMNLNSVDSQGCSTSVHTHLHS